jgi:hypothetical protein
MMTNTNVQWLVLTTAAALMAACGGSDSALGPAITDAGRDADPGTSVVCPIVVADADCDKSLRPLVFVHGTFGSGDDIAHVASLLGSNGYCQERLVTIEYNSLGEQPATNGKLDAAIDKVLQDNPGFTQVDLAGHSQGTTHCGTYLKDAAHAAKVAHYINFSGSPAVGDIETLSLSSLRDLQNTPHHATGTHVKTVTFTDEDHFAVAASTNAFIELYQYLRGGERPKYTQVQCGADPVTVEGVAETFADNVPVTGKIEIYEVGDAPRVGAAMKLVTPDAAGHFGPIQLKRGVAYELKGFDAEGKLVGYQYLTPFKRSNRLLRMLAPSGMPLVAMNSTDHVVRGPHHAALVARWTGGAFRQDLGASLTIDGAEVLTSEVAGAAALTNPNLAGGVVGLFLYDANTNAATDLGLVHSAPFIAFTDVFVDATTPKFVDLSFTAGAGDSAAVAIGAKIANWPSSDALVNVVFQ